MWHLRMLRIPDPLRLYTLNCIVMRRLKSNDSVEMRLRNTSSYRCAMQFGDAIVVVVVVEQHLELF